MDNEEVTITLGITLRKRWVPQLMSMLAHMQFFGNVGSSRVLKFYSDGDGDFRPRFTLNDEPLFDKDNGGWNAIIDTPPDVQDTSAPDMFDAG